MGEERRLGRAWGEMSPKGALADVLGLGWKGGTGECLGMQHPGAWDAVRRRWRMGVDTS